MLQRLIGWLPKPVARTGFQIAHRLRIRLWRILKPKLRSVSVVATNPQGKLLLVRTSYGGKNWQFPGGAIERGELPEVAAKREFEEETGCEVSDVRQLVMLQESVIGTTATTYIFLGRFDGQPTVDGREIVEADVFARDALPNGLTERTMARVEAFDRDRTTVSQ